MLEFEVWAIKEGAKDWEEEKILSLTKDLKRVEAAKKWATKNGWKNIRVSEFRRARNEKEFFDQMDLKGSINI